jgi:uncharacterized paraquat-inducible protein A
MEKKECPACVMNIDAHAMVCPVCGYEFPARTSSSLKWIAFLLAAMFLLYIIYSAI